MTEYIMPEEIESRSFDIIRGELAHPLDPVCESVIMRVIHTTADFEYADTLAFSNGAVESAVTSLRRGAPIISDTNMIKAGVDKKRLNMLGGGIYCFMSDEDVAQDAKGRGVTRAYAAVDKAVSTNKPFINKPLIFAIGNAPTALMRLCELVNAGRCSPELIIGVPVGFVNVVEAKEALMGLDVPYIVSRGRKGGSTVAAAILNALMRIALSDGGKNA